MNRVDKPTTQKFVPNETIWQNTRSQLSKILFQNDWQKFPYTFDHNQMFAACGDMCLRFESKVLPLSIRQNNKLEKQSCYDLTFL